MGISVSPYNLVSTVFVMLTYDEIAQHDFKNQNVLIIGNPATGKTNLLAQLKKSNPTHYTINTDDYMSSGYEQGLYDILDDLKGITAPTIIEGVQGFRLLRKGLQKGVYRPRS